jgi:microsomal dipeptidase-like Zn-dependent dipeptidase
MSDEQPSAVPAPRVPLGGDYWQADPGTELWGFADLHAHLMAHLTFGGNAFWGQFYDPERTGDDAMEHALASCEPMHGGLLNVNPEFGHPAGGGWPDFIIWPRFTTLVHQQAYIDWLYRAYQGGLRLISCLAVNNELLGTRSRPNVPTDDRSAIARQVMAMKEMVSDLDRRAGGPGQGWMQIAYSPDQARAIIKANKLAIVLGVEVDSLGNWRRVEDLQELCSNDPGRARELIGAELDWLYGLGIRQITPIHLTDNAFGGTAIYMRLLDILNIFVTGRHYNVENAWETGVRYRLDRDGTDVVDDVERAVVAEGDSISPQRKPNMTRQALIREVPAVRDLYEALESPTVGGGHANVRGLNEFGVILLQEMMRRGMLIDIDHMSQKSTDAALDMAEQLGYPVVSSHAWFRDLAFSADVEFDGTDLQHYGTDDVHKVAHEAGKRADQVERIGRLGGIIGPILNQGDVLDVGNVLPELADKVPHPCAGSSTSWASSYLYAVEKMGGRGVAMGSDINGAAALPGPRFGTYAAYGTRGDNRRLPLRRAQIDAQTNGVRYATPIRDYRWYRFDESGSHAYDREEREAWQAVAQYAAGFHPDRSKHPDGDAPPISLTTVDNALHMLFRQDNVDNITRGLWAADEAEAENAAPVRTRSSMKGHWRDEQWAAYLVKRGLEPAENERDDDVLRWFKKIGDVWTKWQEMSGDNPPLKRNTVGPRRDFDINLDGLAHYGLLPDFLQDLRNQGLAIQDLATLFRSAHDYVEVWATCEQRAAALAETTPAPTGSG